MPFPKNQPFSLSQLAASRKIPGWLFLPAALGVVCLSLVPSHTGLATVQEALANRWYGDARRCGLISGPVQVRAAGVRVSRANRPVYGGTITQENGYSVAHSLADDALIDQADGGGMVAVRREIREAEKENAKWEAAHPFPACVHPPKTVGIDPGTYTDPGQPR